MGVVAAISGALAVLLQCVRGIPQVVHLWRGRRADGVSLSTWTSTLICSSLWAVFGVTHAMATQILGNCSIVVSCVVVLALVARARRRAVVVASGVGIAGVAGVLFVSSRFPAFLSVVAVIMAVGGALPQLVESLREAHLEGVSSVTWALGAVNAALWTVYGVCEGSVPVIAASAAGIPICAVIAHRAATSHKRVGYQNTSTAGSSSGACVRGVL